MLADHIESQLLGGLNVIKQRLVRRRRVEPVRPPPLIKRAQGKVILVIELQPHNAMGVPGGG